ncbi:MAG: ABC transporter permease [Gammaproteobacteria bacterium]|nr:permease-like cell division protein FtsX [Gammaproteobacteria bacterium]NND36609.1 ABC transporter permease [Gammaproteobacteria bacterium]
MNKFRIYLARHAQNCIGALGAMTRQPVASSLTVAVIGIALAMPSALNVIVQSGRAVAGGWDDVRDFSVYLRPDASIDQAIRLRDQLRDSSIIESARLISADDALLEFQNDPEFGSLLAALDSNPLPHTIVIRPSEDAAAIDLQELEAGLSKRTDVDLVKLDTDWVKRLNAMLDLARRGAVIAAIMLVGAVIVIIGNTIRLDIQNRRAEIEVTKLLGGSDGFVRRPFLYTGFWYGLLGGSFALLLLGFSLWLLSGPMERLAGLYGAAFEPPGVDGGTALAILLGGLLAGLGGAWSAVARHLAAIQPKV